MKALAATIIGLLPVLVAAGPVDAWLNPPAPNLITAKPTQVIPENQFFEVSASRLGAAEEWLSDKSSVPQSQDVARYFGQPDFQCSTPKQLYLIRAVYENGGTGAFELSRYGSALLVSHGSLGPASGLHRTALVACLEFQPQEVFHALHGAV